MMHAPWLNLRLIGNTLVLFPLSFVSVRAKVAWRFGPYAAWRQIKAGGAMG